MNKKLYLPPRAEMHNIQMEACIAAGSAQLSGGDGSNPYQPVIEDSDQWSSGGNWNQNVDF